MVMTFLLILGLMTVSFFAWSYIHEKSHVVAAQKTVGLEWYKMKLYPHKGGDGTFYWASVRYQPSRDPTLEEDAKISLAPRVPGLVAAVLCPFFAFMPVTLGTVWLIFWGAGVIDLINGSLGDGDSSDIIKAANSLRIKPWKLRLIGLAALPTMITFIASVIWNL